MSLRFQRVQDPGYIPDLVRIARKTFIDAFGPMHDPDDMQAYLDAEFTHEAFAEKIQDKSACFFLFGVEEWQGYLRINLPDKVGHPLELQRIYILEEAQGKGYGRMAMEFYENLAKDAGANSVVLGVWDEDPRAIGFYSHLGYQKTGRRPFPFGNDLKHVFLMEKKLAF